MKPLLSRLHTGVVAVAMAGSLGAAASAGGNLLLNPSFEAGGGSLQDWNPFNNISPNFEYAQDGIASAKTFGPFGDPFGGTGAVQLVQGVVVPGQVYGLSCFALTPALDSVKGTTNFAVIKVEFFDPDFNFISESETRIIDGTKVDLPEDEWIFGSVEKVAPPNAAHIQAVFVFVQPIFEGGAIWFDNFVMSEIGPAPTEFQNGSFEPGTSYWDRFGNSFHNSNFAEDGCFSMLTFSGGPGTDAGVFQDIPASAGDAFELTGSAFSPSNDSIKGGTNFALLSIEFFENGIPLGFTQATVLDGADSGMPEDTWVAGSVTATAPFGTTHARAVALIVSPDGSTGAVYFDSIGFAGASSCPSDVDGNGDVGFSDLLEVLGDWGPCPGCPADIDGNGDVGFSDLLEVLADWGPCP